jgi:hypothetical protein
VSTDETSWLETVSDAAVADNTVIANTTRHGCHRDQKYIVVFYCLQWLADMRHEREWSIEKVVDV